MNGTASYLSIDKTGYFSKIIVDYVNNTDALSAFTKHAVSIDGIRAAIEARQAYNTDRQCLVDILNKQYAAINTSPKVRAQINTLLDNNTFTITTAHQPAIFTGTLYFIYKIVHAIRLAERLNKELAPAHFVPVYYMGSEDADLEELGKIYLDGEKIKWNTDQTGAVGRMRTTGLNTIIDRIQGEYGNEPFGAELVDILKNAYLDAVDIQTATLRLVDALFSRFGLIVVIADHAAFKRQMTKVFEDDLFRQTPSRVVGETTAQLSKNYKVQATPRDINLFYLDGAIRGRIEKVKEKFIIHGSTKSFDGAEITQELNDHPERFSPNVILRGLFQETILPNIAFIGGGGEMAYWLELKSLFEKYARPFPVLILRNSFLIVRSKWQNELSKTGISNRQLFQDETSILNTLVRHASKHQLNLREEFREAEAYYAHLESIAREIDPTLAEHVKAIGARAIKPIHELEKKLLRAEKRRHGDLTNKIHSIKTALFPLDNLQERIDNFIPYYSSWGPAFIDLLYHCSHTLEQDFAILNESV